MSVRNCKKTVQQYWLQILRIRQPDNVYAAFHPLLIMTYLFGTIPFQLSKLYFYRKPEVIYSPFGFINVIFILSLYLYVFITGYDEFETVVTHFLNSDISQRAFIYQEYLAISLMVMTYVFSFYYRNDFIEMLRIIDFVDERIKILKQEINFKTSLRYSTRRILGWILAIMGGLIISNMLLKHANLYPTFKVYYIYYLPHVIFTFCILTYLCVAETLVHRVFLLNKILRNFSKVLMDKNKPQKKEIKSYNSRRLQAFLVFSTVPTTPEEIVEESCKIHSSLVDATSIADKYFTNQMLTIIMIGFLIIVFNAYYVLEIFLGQGRRDINFETTDFVAFFSSQLILYAIIVFAIVQGSSGAISQSEKTPVYVHNLINLTNEPGLREKLSMFSLQLVHRKVRFTAAGLFDLDRTLIFTIVGAVTTYLVILIQFTSTDAPGGVSPSPIPSATKESI